MLILVRHGRTEANATGRLQGRLDLPLDEEGHAQARVVAAHVRATQHVRRVVSSPLRRARETADAFGLAYDIDPRWEELSYGVHEGATMASVGAATWARWRDDVHFAPEGGESLHELGRRVRAACADLADEAREHDVVVVSHVSPIKAAVAWALGVDVSIAWRCHLDQAAVCRIAVHANSTVLVSFNESPPVG